MIHVPEAEATTILAAMLSIRYCLEPKFCTWLQI
jgi:hypothetical protein